jgi:predicted component of type VI protein secretion system
MLHLKVAHYMIRTECMGAVTAITDTKPLDIEPDPPRGFRLSVTRGPSEGLVVESTGAELSVGSAPGNDLVLNDLLVSRRHLIVEWHEGSYWVRYAGLTNTDGMTVSERAFHSSVLRDDSELMLGETTIHFEVLK